MNKEQHAELIEDSVSFGKLSDQVHKDQIAFSSMNEGNEVTKTTMKLEPEGFGDTKNVQSLFQGTKRKRDELYDDDEDEDIDALESAQESLGSIQMEAGLQEKSKLVMWHYVDPQGDVQGPFLLEAFKFWYDLNYFPSDFKVWKVGENRDEAVLLVDVLQKEFSI